MLFRSVLAVMLAYLIRRELSQAFYRMGRSTNSTSPRLTRASSSSARFTYTKTGNERLLYSHNYHVALARLNAVVADLDSSDPKSSDNIAEKVNTVRRIMEFVLKVECCSRELTLNRNYSQVLLGDLISTVKSNKEPHVRTLLGKLARNAGLMMTMPYRHLASPSSIFLRRLSPIFNTASSNQTVTPTAVKALNRGRAIAALSSPACERKRSYVSILPRDLALATSSREGASFRWPLSKLPTDRGVVGLSGAKGVPDAVSSVFSGSPNFSMIPRWRWNSSCRRSMKLLAKSGSERLKCEIS